MVTTFTVIKYDLIIRYRQWYPIVCFDDCWFSAFGE